MTLMLRPFNFDTLAVRVYELASDERLEEASTAALLIVLVGTIPVFLAIAAILGWRLYRDEIAHPLDTPVTAAAS